MVERGPEKAGVGGSIPSLATTLEQLTKRVPSTVTWVVVNEGQGQLAIARMVNPVRSLNPSRLISEASGQGL